jgi:hypothetical protein
MGNVKISVYPALDIFSVALFLEGVKAIGPRLSAVELNSIEDSSTNHKNQE